MMTDIFEILWFAATPETFKSRQQPDKTTLQTIQQDKTTLQTIQHDKTMDPTLGVKADMPVVLRR